MQFYDMYMEREDFVRACIDMKTELMLQSREDLAHGEAEAGIEKSGQHKPSVLSRLAVPSVPGEKSTGKVKKEEER